MEMKRIPRLIPVLGLLAAIVSISYAGTSTAAVSAPVGLHGFLLTANEPSTTTFHRTPSFAWKPVNGAVRYEFQLSTSETFRENGILYDVANLQTPVVSPSLTLPWITGSPHALFARVRAFISCGCSHRAGPWSADYGFDVVPPNPPKPMTSAPGLLRWTQVDGADTYEVWLLDIGRIISVNTNVVDEREYYNLQTWDGTVHWRVRALRMDEVGQKNGMPVAMHGAWSPIYTSTSSAPTSGPIVLNETVSDTISNGSPSSPSHSLAPGFVWSGNEDLNGQPEPYFRVYVFTDSGCLNRVFASPILSSQAYAPRLLPSANPVKAVTYDGEEITPNEEVDEAKPTTSIGKGPDLKILPGSQFGAPIDLWDTNWPSSGYYWTVIPVGPVVDQQTQAVTGWQDVELAQDACAAGRVARFGISSRPSVTRNHNPFATGLSSRGTLVSGTKTNTFYGQPLIAWAPTPNAYAYEVQWAKKAYPFTPRGKRLTWDTSFVLPLKPGKWYYRVRGYDYNLPTGAQEMAWSPPVKLVVAMPKFRILGSPRR